MVILRAQEIELGESLRQSLVGKGTLIFPTLSKDSRRPILDLSDTFTRSSENGSPNQGRDETGEKVSPKRELMVSHCFPLAQARKSSLSETDALAWVKTPSLSENGEHSCLCVLFA
ncbi:hypothetical protein DEO72_LG3g1856 [Vigna unguiculata]|uniref:Uncharacterized protein n=1 Tax=Vigna unguiculata TaxID=3917 RepID=A0A4D6LFB9_VIGUN|nr:hypothetical protein DEO72_LG3g1856 [Vigna unguiculata]